MRKRIAIAWVLVLVAILLAFPNIGPCSFISHVAFRGDKMLSKVTIEDEYGRGKWLITGYATFMNSNYVSVGLISTGDSSASNLVFIKGGGDVFDEDVSLQQTSEGVKIFWYGHSTRSYFLPDSELFLLRLFGPRVILDGQARPLWSIFDILDSLVLLIISGAMFALQKRQSTIQGTV